VTAVPVGRRGSDLSAVAALFWREWRVFRRIWFAPAFGSVVEPIVYLLVFGYGFGALVSEVAGISYLDFMATGAAANAVLLTGLFAGAFTGFFRRTAEHLYDGLLSTPIGVAHVIAGEATWTGARCAGVAVTTIAVAWAFGVELAWSAAWVPVIGFVGGFAFACLGAAIGARMRSDQQVDVVVAGVFAPMFVVSWTFFPLDDAPAWLQWPAQVSPLTHLVGLLRAAALGRSVAGDVLVDVVVLAGFTVLFWALAVRSLRAALMD
jgi:lipooligosaccharide transport system permease protein